MAGLTFTFTIASNATLQRISNMLDGLDYVFDPTAGTTDTQQRQAFFKQWLIAKTKEEMFNYERKQLIQSGGNPGTQSFSATDISAT
jgi:hypothetical protein